LSTEEDMLLFQEEVMENCHLLLHCRNEETAKLYSKIFGEGNIRSALWKETVYVIIKEVKLQTLLENILSLTKDNNVLKIMIRKGDW